MGITQVRNESGLDGLKEQISKTWFLLLHNPLLFIKKLIIRLRSSLLMPNLCVKKMIKGVLFEFDFNYDPIIKSMYLGDYEIDTIRNMRKYLKKGDIFVDVGANIGYLSAIALGIIGKSGEVHSFEPVPRHFHKLRNIAITNSVFKIIVNQVALSEEQGKAKIAVSNLTNIGWNTMVPNFMPKETIKYTVDVPTCRFDAYAQEKKLDRISLVKIDTEGYEFLVLKGFSGYFENCSYLPVIICEIAPAAYPKIGHTLTQLSEYIKKYNYQAYSMTKTDTEINLVELKWTTDVLFVPC